MKTILLALLLALASLELSAQPALPGPGRAPAQVAPAAPAVGAQPEETVPPGYIDFQGVDVGQVLKVYAKLVNRTILHAQLPDAKIVLETQTTLTKSEAIEALQAVLAMNNVSVVNIGDKFVKAGPSDQANTFGAEFNNQNATNLPDLGTYVTRIVQLHYVKPSQMMQALTPFQKLQNSIIAIDDNGILIIRDYAENVKRMLEMIAKIDIDVPAVYVSEVIPIRYAKVDEIASALNSLGGSGGSTVSIGTAPNTGQISGLAGNRGGGITGMSSGVSSSGGINGGSANPFSGGAARSLGGATANPNGTPSSPTSYTQRLNNLLGNRSQASGGGGGDAIQLFGQTKIIPDESSSSLLVFATRPDMDMITNIIAKLDVPLAQVLVEAVIVDYSLGPNTFNFGVSAAQNPTTLTGNSQIAGGGNNGASFLNFAQGVLSGNTNNGSGTSANSTFASSLGSGLSYFGNIGPSWDLAMTAVSADSHATIIQRPRIQTSQAKPAQFFVGETVPYITSFGNYGYGNQSSYSQLSVGVELDVTPFINPDGLVVMDIQQEIDDIIPGAGTTINGSSVPSTTKRTLNAELAVRDRDTVMLGGFIKSGKSTGRTGVPWLMDIPLLGNLFSSRSDSKQREELIVLLRPTVLKTPELAAMNTIKEEQRLPGVSAAAADDAQDEAKLIEAERKKELENFTNGVNTNGFFNMFMPPDTTTNAAPAASGEISAPENMTGMKSGTPMDSAAAQEKARAGLRKKTAAPDAEKNTPPVSPAQKARLNVLLNSYMAGKISSEEYAADRQKILSEGR